MVPRLGLILGVRSGVVLDLNRRQMSACDRGQRHGDDHAGAHAELTNGQSTKDRCQGEGDSVGGSNQTIGPVMSILRDKKGDRRRQGDGAQISNDRPGEDQSDEHPCQGLPK